MDFEEHRLEALPGDVFLLLTDGILEACNPRDEEFGYEGVEEALRNCRGACESEIKDALRRALAVHCDGVEPRDDQTLMVLRVDGRSGRSEPG